MHHTLVVTVDNQPDALQRVAGLLRRKNFGVQSLTVAATEDPGTSRLTVVVDSRTSSPRLVTENLYKLIAVRRVADLAEEPGVARELVLLRVRAGSATRAEVLQLAQLQGARVVEVSPASLVLEMSATSVDIARLVALLRPFGILAMTRSGALALPAAAPEEWEDALAPALLSTNGASFIEPLAEREGV
ncbi:MAG TPA: acetolactate synthase small subunit [Thermoanaerobaculia bacterium]|jgi:acetolactate synthase-1/3 small subunit|nr:acetolactate synthase small subunit [Thermoanaerobaculia bacterium]